VHFALTPVSLFLVLTFGSAFLAAFLLEGMARRRLSPLGDQHRWWVYWFSFWAGRKYFTSAGWRYHLLAMLAAVLAFAIGLVLQGTIHL
jgi:hypothetical protein